MLYSNLYEYCRRSAVAYNMHKPHFVNHDFGVCSVGIMREMHKPHLSTMSLALMTRVVKIVAETRHRVVRKATAFGKLMLQPVEFGVASSIFKRSRMLQGQWEASSDEGDNAFQPDECVQMTDDKSDFVEARAS